MSQQYSIQSELDADEWDAEFRRKRGDVMTTQTKHCANPNHPLEAHIPTAECGHVAARIAPTILEEFVMAKVIANKALDRISSDPDDDLAILARQFLRAAERMQAAYARRLAAESSSDDADVYAESQVRAFALEAANTAEKYNKFDIRDAFKKIAENYWL